ncbi:Abcb9, partial [Symbiodinium natans]
MILDDDVFPSNTYREVIMEHDEEALYEIGFGLLYSFMRTSVFFGALLGSICRLFVCPFNSTDPSTLDRLWVQHLEGLCQRVCRACAARVQRICSVSAACLQATEIPGDRDGTAVALGLAWILPNARLLVMSQTLRLSWHDKPLASKFILLASDYFEMAVLEMGFNIRYHLRVNLFRKYLRYTPESRAKVPIQDLKISIMEDIPDLVADGYLIIFELWAMFGKIVMVGIFMARKHPRSAFPLFVYPILILIYLVRTYRPPVRLWSQQIGPRKFPRWDEATLEVI